MTCIKTGAHVYLADYGEWIYGDAFLIEGTFILNTNVPPSRKAFRDLVHYSVASNPQQLCFGTDHSADAGIKVLQENGGVLIVPFDQVIEHGYEGIPVQEIE